MPTASSATQQWHTTTAAKSDVGDIEPDDEWKANLRKRIEGGLQSMVKEAKDSLEQQILKAPADKARLLAEHQEAMGNIRALAAEQFSIELDRERQERRWAAGLGMNPKWTEALVQEQQTILSQIKQTGSQNERNSNSNESPVEERPPSASRQIPVLPIYNPPPLPPQMAPMPPLREERDRRSAQGTFARRGSDTQSTSPRDRGDHISSLRRPKAPVHQRGPMPEWTSQETPDDTDGLSKSPPLRSPWSAMESPMSPDRAESVSARPIERSTRLMPERHVAHSPPNPSPMIWKPSMSPEEDAAASSKHYGLGRRGSTASMRSIGSTNSMRLATVTDSIPERADDSLPDLTDTIQREQQKIEEEMQRMKEVEKEWANRDQARQRHDPRDPIADPGLQSEDGLMYPSIRSPAPFLNHAGSMPVKKPLSSKTSFSRDYPNPDTFEYTKPAQSKTFRNALTMDTTAGVYHAAVEPGDRPPHQPRNGPVSRKPSFVDPYDAQVEHPIRASKRRSTEKPISFHDEREDFYPESPLDKRHGRHPMSGLPTPPTSASRRGMRNYEDDDFDDQLEYDDFPRRHELDYGPRPRSDSSEFEHQKKPRAKWKKSATKPVPPLLAEPTPHAAYRNTYSRHSTQPISVPRSAAPTTGFDDQPWTRWGLEEQYPVPHTADPRANPYSRRQDDTRSRRSANPLQSEPLLTQPPPTSHRLYRHDHPANFPHRRDATSSEEEEEEDDNGGDGEDEEDDSEEDSESEEDYVDRVDYKYRSRRPPGKDTRKPDHTTAKYGSTKQTSAPRGKGKEHEVKEREKTRSKGKGKDRAWHDTQQHEEERRELERRQKKLEDEERLREEREAALAKLEKEREEKEEAMAREKEEREREAKADRERTQKEAEENERLFNEARQKAEEALRIANEAAAKQEWAKEQEVELRRKTDEAVRLQAEAERKRAEAVKLTEEVRVKQEIARQKELEIYRKEVEIKERELLLQQREEESRRRDEERREQEVKRIKEKELMEKREKKKAEKKKRDDEKRERAEQEERERERERQKVLREEREKREKEERERQEAEENEREDKARREREEWEREERAREKWEQDMREQKAREERAQQEQADREERAKEEIARLEREREEMKRREQEQREREEKERFERVRKEQEEREKLEREWSRQKVRRDEEAARRKQDELERERRLEEERIKSEQQEEFRKREEEIRRRTGERKRQDSVGTEGTWPNGAYSTSSSSSKSPPTRAPSANFSASGDRSSGSSSAWTSSTSSAWSASTPATSASSTAGAPRSSTATPNKPRAGSVGSGSFQSASPHSATNPSSFEAEWARRQAEQARQQQEKFRLEQERLEAQRQARTAGKALNSDDLIRLFEKNEKMWVGLSSMDTIRWADIPWPMIKRPSNPEDITTFAIESYILSPHYPDKSRSDKDRIKDFIKRFHPDRFDTKLLVKVLDEEREKVKEGAGYVVRSLNDLLTRKNEPTNEARWND